MSHSVLNIVVVSHSVRISTAVTHSVLKIEAVSHSVLNSETVFHSVLSSTVLFHSCWPCSFIFFVPVFLLYALGFLSREVFSAALLFLKDVDYVVCLVLLAAQESEEKLAGQILKYLSEGCINSHLSLSPRSHISRGHGTHQVADSLKKLNP